MRPASREEDLMSEQAAFLDRMTQKLADLESGLRDLGTRADAQHRQKVRDLQASLSVQRERLAALRREGAELSLEKTQSFAQHVEALSAEVGRVQSEIR
jgi:hypothetical protein